MLDVQRDFQDMLKGSDELRQQYESNKTLVDSLLHALSVYKSEPVVANMSIMLEARTPLLPDPA